MSTILKALRRLEHDKARPLGGRPLREEVVGTAAAPRARGSWKAAAAALAAGVGLGALGLLFWSIGGSVERQASDPSPADVAAAAAAPAARSEQRLIPSAPFEPDTLEPGPPPEAFASRVEVIERPVPTPLVANEEVRSPRPPRAGQLPPHVEAMLARNEARSASPEPLERVSAPAAAAPPPVVVPEPEARRPLPSPVAEARPAAEPVATPPAVPEVLVEKTVWHPDPKRREAVVSVTGRDGSVRVHEGDKVGLLVVSEIQPTGVRFTHQGVALERRVGRAD